LRPGQSIFEQVVFAAVKAFISGEFNRVRADAPNSFPMEARGKPATHQPDPNYLCH
jgi:hypothetical protein